MNPRQVFDLYPDLPSAERLDQIERDFREDMDSSREELAAWARSMREESNQEGGE